jgi:hypothetical protein
LFDQGAVSFSRVSLMYIGWTMGCIYLNDTPNKAREVRYGACIPRTQLRPPQKER